MEKKNKAIIAADVRDILDEYDNGKISYGRMVQKFNEVADKFADEKLNAHKQKQGLSIELLCANSYKDGYKAGVQDYKQKIKEKIKEFGSEIPTKKYFASCRIESENEDIIRWNKAVSKMKILKYKIKVLNEILKL